MPPKKQPTPKNGAIKANRAAQKPARPKSAIGDGFDAARDAVDAAVQALGERAVVDDFTRMRKLLVTIDLGKGPVASVPPDATLILAGELLQAARLLRSLSSSPVHSEALQVIEAMTDALADGAIALPMPRASARVVRDAHRVVMGGQPGNDRGAKIRRIAECLRFAADLPVEIRDDDGDRLIIAGTPYASAIDWLLSALDEIDPAFRAFAAVEKASQILASYQRNAGKPAALHVAVADLLVASGALVAHGPSSRAPRGRAKLLGAIKKAIQRPPKDA